MQPQDAFGTPVHHGPIKVPEAILKKIKNGWIAALVSGVMTFGLVLLNMATDSGVMGIDACALVDVALIFGLAFGIYIKSRVASSLMFVYFVLSKIIALAGPDGAQGIVMAIFFVVFFFQAAQGCFQYHDWIKKHGAPEGPAPTGF